MIHLPQGWGNPHPTANLTERNYTIFKLFLRGRVEARRAQWGEGRYNQGEFCGRCRYGFQKSDKNTLFSLAVIANFSHGKATLSPRLEAVKAFRGVMYC
ncbi:MAG TPA: hypothetical protein PKK82_06050 [Anaerolineaceae bacterium]|nr:hypothetical protein [Anaerolineaceae bacterium]